MRRLLRVLVSVTPLGFSSCGSSQECDDSGLMDLVTFEFAQPITERGTYSFVVAASEATGTCSAAITETIQSHCDGRVFLETSGSGTLSPEITSIKCTFDAAPSAIELRVTRDGTTLYSISAEPEYSSYERGGSSCAVGERATVLVE
jgi:hypothetical protein